MNKSDSSKTNNFIVTYFCLGNPENVELLIVVANELKYKYTHMHTQQFVNDSFAQ